MVPALPAASQSRRYRTLLTGAADVIPTRSNPASMASVLMRLVLSDLSFKITSDTTLWGQLNR